MRQLKFKLDRRFLQTIYFSLIRPLLEYADVVWENCTQYEVNDLEKIQNEAARIVTSATKLASINSLLSETGWETLSSRRKKHKLQLFYKMQNDLSPNYLIIFSATNSWKHLNISTTKFKNLHTIHTNSQLYSNSFLPSAIRDWNELPEEIRSAPSLSAFKHELNRNIRMPPKFYFIGKRLGQIYCARLRTNCSSLNLHLFSKNLTDSPLCACGSVEDTYHYFLLCYRFSNLRRDLLNSVSMICRPTTDVFLFGIDELSTEQNKNIFLAVQNFMLKTKRFQVN